MEIDCTNYTESNALLAEIVRLLDFPKHFRGKSFDAFKDLLSSIEINDGGTVVVFKHFDLIENKFAHTLLDILTNNSREHIVFGRKLLTLVQVDNPEYRIDPIGSTDVLWSWSTSRLLR